MKSDNISAVNLKQRLRNQSLITQIPMTSGMGLGKYFRKTGEINKFSGKEWLFILLTFFF